MQLESIQGDLESIKELFRGDEYTLDTSALMGVSFSEEVVFWFGCSITHFVDEHHSQLCG